jgi:hypothetical protein
VRFRVVTLAWQGRAAGAVLASWVAAGSLLPGVTSQTEVGVPAFAVQQITQARRADSHRADRTRVVQSSRAAMSVSDQMRSDTPAAIAGVLD